MTTQDLIRILLLIATLAPLASAVLVIFLGQRVLGKASGWFATAVLAGCFACALAAALKWYTAEPPRSMPAAVAAPAPAPAGAAAVGVKSKAAGEPLPAAQTQPEPRAVRGPGTIVWNVPWLPIGHDAAGNTRWLYLGVLIDNLTIAMMTMVTFIAFLVHLYSIGYMEGDPRFAWFFAYLSLFTFSMLGIVMSNSILELFVFWELVGLTSYLLIGFWFEKRGPQLACKKAFVMNRIGDVGFLIGFGILFYQLGGQVLLPAAGVDAGGSSVSMFEAIRKLLEAQGHSITNPPLWLTAAGIGLFFGAIGKSAQFPLHTWLPDAMEGPTPVSSIVHSATMVAAGVYLTGRIYPILTPAAHLFVATIGLITLVIAACMALVMTDIKRVLAYSTLSQLGYMILGLGAGAWAFALFHLITHAFFKCCLFQCAGSVIHGAHHQQDMRYYGGLGRKMTITAVCFAVCTLAIAGASIPYSQQILGIDIGISGFYSKDGIIAGTFLYGEALRHAGWVWGGLFYWAPLLVAYVTCFYMARAFTLTFLGQPRDPHLYEHAHEAPLTMWLPQLVLAVMAVVSVPALVNFLGPINDAGALMQQAMKHEGSVAWVQPGVPDQMEHGFHFAHSHLLFGLGWILALGAGVGLYLPGMKYSAKLAALPGVRLLHTWFLNKFYFDALYDTVAVNAGKFVAYVAAWIDSHLVDGLVNLAGLATRGWSYLAGQFDNRVVDGAVNGAAAAAQSGGRLLRTTQDGRVRLYVTLLFGSASVATLVVLVVVLVGR